jgi:ParB family chromosome partitioning protein
MKRYAEEEAFEDELDDDGHLGTGVIEAVIEREYVLRLDTAPFPLGDAKLVAAAGPCTSCPKRSVNQPALFSEPDRKDVCTDVACWRTKVAVLAERERKEVFAAGGTVLLEQESRRVFNGGSTLPWNSPWIDLEARCPDHPDLLPWRELLGDFCPPPVLAFTPAGKPVRLAKREEAIDALVRNGVDLGALRGRGQPTDDEEGDAERVDDADVAPPSRPAEEPANARFAADVARMTRQRLLAAVVAAAETAPPDDNRFVSLVYETILHGGYHNAVVDTLKRRLGKVPKGELPAAALAAIAAVCPAPALRALILELCLSRGAYFVMSSDKYPRDLARAIEAYGIDAPGIEKAVAEELGAKRAARVAKAKHAGA